jgi:hypothetical protein
MRYFDKFNEGEIVALKMTSGEEVVAKMVAFDHDGIIVARAVSLAQTHDGKLTLVPFSAAGDLETEGLILKSAIMLMCRPKKNMEDAYNKATSPLHVPPAAGKILLG